LKQGAKDFVVNLAGNMRCYGKPEAGRSWRVGVRDPFHAGAVIGMIELGEGMAVATSGNYERFVEIEGKRYSHIVDPRTGWPVTGMAGVTVVAPSAAAADALSTAFFVLGPEEGNKVLGLFTNCAALFVPDKDGLEIQLTPGMDRYFKMSPDVKARVTTLGGGAVAGSMDKPRADQ
jgi:thiamine biosynthesis lipoprotein